MVVKRGRIYDIVITALMTAVMCVASFVTIPVGAVPVTLQTFVVYIACAVLGTKKAVISVVLYLLLGMLGLPVFSSFRGGIGVLVGATGGYILGFLLIALISGLIIVKKQHNRIVMFFAFFAGTLMCYLAGTLWYVIFYIGDMNFTNFIGAFSVCVVPFIVPDIIKMIVASIVAKALCERGVINENNRQRA